MIADLLVVCGFAFDPLAGEEASALGRLTMLQARMNPDLAMGDELLKKTGTATWPDAPIGTSASVIRDETA